MSQEKAEKLSQLNSAHSNEAKETSVLLSEFQFCQRERIPGFLVQRCGFPSQEAQEAISNRLQKS